MKLQKFFTTIAPFLEGRIPHAEAVKALYGSPEGGAGGTATDARRLAIYGEFCRTHRFEVIDSIYIHVRRAVLARGGEAAWEALVETFFLRHPMRHFELNTNGAALPEFLGEYVKEQGLPAWLPELADLEWWEWLTDTVPSADEGKGLRLAPTAELRPYHWDLVEWMDAEPSERPEAPEARDVLVLFWRDTNLSMRRENTSPEELLVLKAVTEGLALGDAARAAGVPRKRLEATFRDLVDAGILLGAD